MSRRTAWGLALAGALTLGSGAAPAQETRAYAGATLWDGTGVGAVSGATLVVREGRVVSVGTDAPPPGATVVDLSGRWIIPGLIDAHAHVSGRWADEDVDDEDDRIVGDLQLFAAYGVTTVNSLGGGTRASIEVRNRQNRPSLAHARLLVAGPVVTGPSAEEARAQVADNAAMGVDWIKMRVDDNLGTAEKMAPPAYRAAIDEAHTRGLRAATHLFYLDDAKLLLQAGTDLVAHSIRDTDVDQDVIDLLLERDVCYVPTLTREVSTYVYETRPGFFDDPFFLELANEAEIERLSDPEVQASFRESPAAAAYRTALFQAMSNLRALRDAGVRVAFGTDAGPPARFPGYFEHMELGLMVGGAGLTPEEALFAATGGAAACLGLEDVGTLEEGKWADFMVLEADPLADIGATRRLEAVYVAGKRVP